MSFSSDKPALESQLPISIELPQDFPEFRYRINDLYQRIAASANAKEGGLYLPEEKTNGQQYFNSTNPQKNMNVYRKVIDFGALPNASSKNVVHGISWNDNFRLTRMYGSSTDVNNLQAVPFPNVGIFLSIDQTNITITTTGNYSSYTSTTVVIEYTKG